MMTIELDDDFFEPCKLPLIYSLNESVSVVSKYVPGIRSMIKACKEDQEDSVLLVTKVSQCTEMLPFLEKNVPLFFVWLPKESNEDLIYLSHQFPSVENRFVAEERCYFPFFVWYKKESGNILLQKQYLYFERPMETCVVVFCNSKIIAASIIQFDDYDTGMLQVAGMSAQSANRRIYLGEESDGIVDESDVYLQGESFLDGNRSTWEVPPFAVF